MFLEREGWRYDRGGRGRRGGGGGGSGGATGPSGGEASVGWTGRPREVLLDGRRGEARLFFLLHCKLYLCHSHDIVAAEL